MTESVKNELSDICRIIDATVDTEKIYLFGSYAYGTIKTDEPRTLDFSGVRGFLVTNVCIVQRSAA